VQRRKKLTLDSRYHAQKGIEILQKLPDAKRILVRAKFYLSKYEADNNMTESSRKNQKEAFELYSDLLGPVKDQSALTAEDFDNLLARWYR